MAKEEKKNKKEKHTGRNITVGVLAVILLSLAGWFGLGGGNGFGTGGSGQTGNAGAVPGLVDTGSTGNEAAQPSGNEEQTQPEAQPAENPEETGNEAEAQLTVAVSEDKITVGGNDVAVEELESALRDAYDGTVPVVLSDDHAIKATYDAVKAALEKLDIPYSEATP